MRWILLLIPSFISINLFGQEIPGTGQLSDSVSQPLHSLLNQVVVTASRHRESLMSVSVGIEKLNKQTIAKTPSLNYYETLQNVKGIDLVSSSLLYKQVNMRGFNSLPNQRFLQLIDGMDNQPPGLNFPTGNLFGVSDLDVESVEIIPGASSALYGPVAYNGLLSIHTKNPFESPGLSLKVTTGINHIGDFYSGIHGLNDLSARFAKQIGKKMAIKLNGNFTSGKDWYAYNFTDIDAQTPVPVRGENNPARNALNIYGDEVARTIAGIGRVSRTGYEEIALTNGKAGNLKFDGNIRYRIGNKSELSYEYSYGKATAIQTGSSRVMLKDFTLARHSIELKGNRYFVRAYAVKENSGNTYDTRRLAQAVNLTWVRDLNGNVVLPAKADETWFQRYEEAFKGHIATVEAGNHAVARAFADYGRLLPSSAVFRSTMANISKAPGRSGAAVTAKSSFYHADLQYDLTGKIKFASLLMGGNFRLYELSSNGTLYDDTTDHIFIRESGLFVQAAKHLLQERLKLTIAARYDKHENFSGRFTPKIAASYMVRRNHYIRFSWQKGFRNPVPTEQFIKNNIGALTILGGTAANSKGMNVYENSFTSTSVNAFVTAVNAAISSGSPLNQAVDQSKNLLVKSALKYIQPEKMQSVEIGYRAMLNARLFFDGGYYFSIYKDFVLSTIVVRPLSTVLNNDGAVNDQAAMDVLNGGIQSFNVFTNESEKVYTQGASVALTWLPATNYEVTLNGTWTAFRSGNANPGNIPAFNTAPYKVNLSVSNDKIIKNTGFSLACRWQSAFNWQSALSSGLPGRIPDNIVVDAMASYKFSGQHVLLRIGATNLLNKYNYQAFGASSVGGMYYFSLLFDLPDAKIKTHP